MGYAKTYQKFNGQSSSKLNCKESGGWVAGKVGGVIKVSIAGNANKCRRLHASPSLINCKTTSQWRLFVCTLYRRVGKKRGRCEVEGAGMTQITLTVLRGLECALVSTSLCEVLYCGYRYIINIQTGSIC